MTADYRKYLDSSHSTAPFIASRSGHVIAYRLAGIRRRGLTPDNPRYWFVEFNPKYGLGVVIDSPATISLQRWLVQGGRYPALHFVRLVRSDGQVYWQGHCILRETELELAWLKIEGDKETPYEPEAQAEPDRSEERRGFGGVVVLIAITIAFWALVAWGIYVALS